MGRMGIVPVDNEPEETKETEEPEEETRCFRLTRIDAGTSNKTIIIRIRR